MIKKLLTISLFILTSSMASAKTVTVTGGNAILLFDIIGAYGNGDGAAGTFYAYATSVMCVKSVSETIDEDNHIACDIDATISGQPKNIKTLLKNNILDNKKAKAAVNLRTVLLDIKGSEQIISKSKKSVTVLSVDCKKTSDSAMFDSLNIETAPTCEVTF